MVRTVRMVVMVVMVLMPVPAVEALAANPLATEVVVMAVVHGSVEMAELNLVWVVLQLVLMVVANVKVVVIRVVQEVVDTPVQMGKMEQTVRPVVMVGAR